MQFKRTVDTIVEKLAQKQIADVLVLAFKDIDKFIEDTELAIERKTLLQHVCNERNKECECEYCKVRKEINTLRACVIYGESAPEYWNPDERRTYLNSIRGKLNKLHNIRRRLLGVKEHIFVSRKCRPAESWYFYY